MEENVIQIKSGIMIKIDVTVKNIIYVKKIIYGILLHLVAKTANIQQVLLTITCDKIVDVEEKELFQTLLMKKKQPVKHKISIFYQHFY